MCDADHACGAILKSRDVVRRRERGCGPGGWRVKQEGKECGESCPNSTVGQTTGTTKRIDNGYSLIQRKCDINGNTESCTLGVHLRSPPGIRVHILLAVPLILFIQLAVTDERHRAQQLSILAAATCSTFPGLHPKLCARRLQW